MTKPQDTIDLEEVAFTEGALGEAGALEEVEETAQAVELDEIGQAMVAALQGRADFYDLLAAIYFKPLTAEQVENIATMDLSAYEDINEYFADGINDIRRYLNKRNSGTRQELAVEFTASFGGVSSWKGKYAVPYESVHTSQEGLMYQDAYHEVYHFFKENRVDRGAGYDYPHDHLSFMCEFMAIESHRMIAALEAGDTDEVLHHVEVCQGFLQDHILSWFDTFADLALLLIKTRFYKGILKISKGFFLEDAELLESIALEVQGTEGSENA